MEDNGQDDGDDSFPSPSEQHAFSETHDVIGRLLADQNLDKRDVAEGVLVAAISCLMKIYSEEEVAKILYERADDFATRKQRFE